MSVAARSLVKPPALRPGAMLAVVSPASTPKPELVEAGIDCLHGLGYRTSLYPHALDRGPLYYAGNAEQRAGDLLAAFADPGIDGILCTRGGWGSAELLPHLDAELICANPKVFVGYSDHTSLHIWLAREANLVSFYAPMVAADFARPQGFDTASWQHTFDGDSGWSLTRRDGLRVLRQGAAEGTLAGGCLSILAESLGTSYAPLPAKQGAPRVLFLEDIGERAYKWDRMLLHLRYAGMFEHVGGVVFGDMRQCVAAGEDAAVEQSILHALRDFAGPIAIGLRSGHVDMPNITLPLGVQVQLDLSEPENPRLEFLEAAVAVRG